MNEIVIEIIHHDERLIYRARYGTINANTK
jgi:hypothetical protein